MIVILGEGIPENARYPLFFLARTEEEPRFEIFLTKKLFYNKKSQLIQQGIEDAGVKETWRLFLLFILEKEN
jgi:hypothetical protein